MTIARRYNNRFTVDQDTAPNERKAVEHVLRNAELPKSLLEQVESAPSFDALMKGLDEVEFPPAEEGDHAALTAAVERVRAGIVAVAGEDGDFHLQVRNAVRSLMPKFFYFSDYSFIGGRTDLRHVFGTPEDELEAGERTALSLMRLAGADNETLLDEDYESRTAELEAVSNELTGEMAEYWSQSRELEVVIDVDKQTETLPQNQGTKAVARHLEVRVKDRRHGHTDNIDKRSNGFRWFFSFLAAFSEYEGREDRVIILLDEPALTLHARAQKDFLRFIEERLSPHHQVVFTTHSPFMVEPTHLERARLVEDKGEKIGSKISADVLATDRDTLFPLQAALGYDLAQSMFIAPHNLLLEGISDYIYLHVLSEHLRELGRAGLDERWALLPVRGVTKVPTFLALLGQHLNVTVLVDAGSENKAVAALVKKGHLLPDRFITPADATSRKEADIEDLFTDHEYIELYNATFDTDLKVDQLKGTDRILKRIARARGDFDHGEPAEYLLRNTAAVIAGLSDDTLDRFEALFGRINATMTT